MTAPGSRKYNATGRSITTLKNYSFGKLEGPFVALTKELLASPAWGVLTLADRKVMDRLCLEHMNHAGTENSNLVCTYSDFEAYGVRRASIPDALRRLEVLGLIEVMERGRISRAEFKFPAKYRLTFVKGNLPMTDEWKRIKTREQAEGLVAAACHKPKKSSQTPQKNKKPDAKTRLAPDAKTLPLKAFPGRENATSVPDAKMRLHSISREGRATNNKIAAACPANSKGQGSAAQGDKGNAWQSVGSLIQLPTPARKKG